jgi:hypothetical protein
MTVSSDAQNKLPPGAVSIQPIGLITPQPSILFLYSGLLFLFGALGLFLLLGYNLYRISEQGEPIYVPGEGAGALTDRDIYNFYGKILSLFMAPLFIAISAVICTIVGTRLLRVVGAVSQQVIPPQDFAFLAPAVRDGNEKAISEYIRLSSLSGITGTFTKVGLTGLPLATIILTITLSIFGVFNAKFFDLAQLTLGAFIGSYVQKRSESDTSRSTGTKDKPDAI